MSRAAALLETLRRQGVTVRFDDDNVRVKGPSAVLTEAVYQQILFYQDDLLEILWSEPPISVTPPNDDARNQGGAQRRAVPDDSAVEAVFPSGARIQVRPQGSGRYVLYFRSGGKWHQHKGLVSPTVDHARRAAEAQFGQPATGWHAPEEAVG
jgi:hypothetical protein